MTDQNQPKYEKQTEAGKEKQDDAEWAEFEDFLGKDYEDVEDTKGTKQSSQNEKNELARRNQKEHDEEMTQAAYGARFASLLLKRQKLFNQKKSGKAENNDVENPSREQKNGNDEDKSMYVSPSLAFDEDAVTPRLNSSQQTTYNNYPFYDSKKLKVDNGERQELNELDRR